MTPEEQINKPEDARIVERRAFRRGLVVGSFSLAAVLVLLYGIVKVVRHPFVGYGGDTPVVLIGGSLTIQEGSTDSTQTWGTYGNGYRASSPHAVTEIALKNDYRPKDHKDSHRDDDDNRSTDMGTPIPVTSTASWKVELFAKESNNNAVLLISSDPPGTDYQLTLLDQGGRLCPDPDAPKSERRKVYYLDSKCTVEAHFDKAIVTTNVGTSPPLTCVDSNNEPGYCRIVLRYPPKN